MDMCELLRLTRENKDQLSSSNVCLVSYGENYVNNMVDEFGQEFITGISYYIDLSNKGNDHSIYGAKIQALSVEDMHVLPEDTEFVIVDDYYKEVFQQFKKLSGIKKDVYYFANKETAYDLSYREKYKDEPLKNIVIFRSGPHASAYIKGTDFSDNARALFEYALSVGLNLKYELVWLVKNPDDHRQVAEANKNVKFISFDWSVSDNEQERDEYYNALCTAKYIFFTDAYGFCRNAREDQVRIQLWHGCGFKTRVNFVRCEHRYEFMPVISDKYAEIHKKIYGLRDDQVLVTGYPKDDLVFHPRVNWKELLGIKDARKYILWLPTFRKTDVSNLANVDMYKLAGETGLPLIKKLEDLHKLNDYLEANDVVMVIKLHPFQDSSLIYAGNCSNIIMLDNSKLVEKDIQINEILGFADGLISDYSSVAIDYLLLDRPIAFALEDLEEYEKARGFVFEPIREWLPGIEVVTFEELWDFVAEIVDGCDSSKEKRQRITKELHKYFDDKSSQRLIKALGIVND